MRRRNYVLLSMLLFLAVMLCGCQKASDAAALDGVLTKREWTGLLGNKFGYNAYENASDFYSDVKQGSECYDEIQACAEWGILPETGTFQPDGQTTWRYAIETSVRAIGIEKLNNSDEGAAVAEGSLVEFFTSKIANVDEAVLDTGMSKTDADLILAYAYNYAANLKLPQKMEYTYNEGVKEAEAEDVILKGDGVTAIVKDGSLYKAGDVVYVKPSEESFAYALRVKSVSGNEITYGPAGIEDVYQELVVSGTYEARVVNVVPAEGVTISVAAASNGSPLAYADYAGNGQEILAGYPEAAYSGDGAVNTGFSRDGNNIKFDADLGGSGSLNVAISNINVTADIEKKDRLKKADAMISFDDSLKVEYTADNISEQKHLGDVELTLGSTMFNVKVSLVANVGINGEVKISYSSKMIAMANYQEGKGFASSVSNENVSYDFQAKDVTVAVEPCVKAELRFGWKFLHWEVQVGLANAKVTSGIVAIANADCDLLDDEPDCIDIYMYVPFRWAINEDACFLTDNIDENLKASAVVWDSGSSPVNERFHWEDGELVGECTRGKNKLETASLDEEGKPYDEYNIFDFEEIAFGVIEVASQTIFLSEGESMAIGIISVPDGYGSGDLVYQPENPSICSVSGGIVTATGTGSTTLKISTPDGKFSIYVSVVVEMEYNDTSGFQPL